MHNSSPPFFFLIFIYFWLCWVFVSARGLSLVAASGGHSSSRCAGLSLSWPLLMRSTSSRHAGSVVVAHGLSCSAACRIPPDQGLNPCPLHWQADSQPLRHQGSPPLFFKTNLFILLFYLIYLLFLAVLGLRCSARAFLWLKQVGATFHCGARASHCGGFSCHGERASVVVA